MAAIRQKSRQYEDRYAGSNAPVLGILAIACFGVAFLMTYISFAAPQQGTGMEAIRNVMRGLGGDLFFIIPLVLAGAGALCVLALREKRPSLWRVFIHLLLVVTLFGAVQVFFAERVIQERMTIRAFSNFVVKSYGYGQGGGAIGALLAWPLYRNFGVAGGFIGALLIAVILATLAGYTGRLIHAIQEWNAQRLENAPEKPEKPEKTEKIDKNERKFEKEEQRAPARGSRRETQVPVDDPFADNLMKGGKGSKGRGERGAETGNARRGMNPDKDSRRRADTIYPGSNAAQEPSKGRKGAQKGDARRGQMYREDVRPNTDPLFDVEGFPAENIQSVTGKKGAFAADAPSFMTEGADDKTKKPRAPKGKPTGEPGKEPVKGPVKEPGRKPVKNPNDEIPEELKIRPDEYEKPEEEDDVPFDVPHTVEETNEKKEFPKLTRNPVQEEEPEYIYPPIDLLEAGGVENNAGHGQRDMQKAQLLEETLRSFGIETRLIGIAHGPAVTRFELQPAPGIKVSKITSLSDDIALNLEAMSVRIEAPIPGKAAVGVEIPNDKIEMVRLRDVLESSEARKHPSKIAVGLGKDNSGRFIVADIAKMPHVLIAGQTGSGKSVCINAIITSILFRATPEEVKLILIDPKMVELSMYNDIPHLVCPVVTEPKKAASALEWAVAEMTMRYKKFAERGTKNIKGYNSMLKEGEPMMPQMVIIIDELADLMMVSPGEVEDSICRLAQLARAAGMHLVIATQRPSVNVITGIIKANIPTRIAFSVSSQVDSRTIIDHGGAEKLLGNGDMLYVPPGISKPMRVQGAWISEEEVHSIVEYIKSNGSGEVNYDPDMIEHLENAGRTDAEKEEIANEYDPRLPEAVDFVVETHQASISMLQRHMRIGYARAGRLIDEMCQRGIVSEGNGSKPRDVLITKEQAREMFENE